jgi:hypothetical protein
MGGVDRAERLAVRGGEGTGKGHQDQEARHPLGILRAWPVLPEAML